MLSFVVCVCCCPSILSLEDEEGYNGSLFPSVAAPAAAGAVAVAALPPPATCRGW